MNLFGAEGQNAMPTFTAANFEFTETSTAPEPASFPMMVGAGILGACYLMRRMRGPA